MSTPILPVIEPIVIATPIVITTPTEEVVPEEEEEVLTPTDVVTEPDYASGPRDAPAEVVSVRLQTDELAPLTLAAVRWVTHTRLALLDRTPPRLWLPCTGSRVCATAHCAQGATCCAPR